MSNTVLTLIFVAGALFGFAMTWFYFEVLTAPYQIPKLPTQELPANALACEPVSFVVMVGNRPTRIKWGGEELDLEKPCLMVEATKFATSAGAHWKARCSRLSQEQYHLVPTIYTPNFDGLPPIHNCS